MTKKLYLTLTGLATAGLLSAITLADKAQTRAVPQTAVKDVSSEPAPRMKRVGVLKSVPMRAPEGGYTAPVSFKPTEEQFEECTLIDLTGYNKNWSFSEGSFRSAWNSQAPMDAWCILPPMNLEAAAYKVSYTYYTKSDVENFTLSLGTSTDPESMTITVLERLEYSNQTAVTESATVDIPSAGTWHFGLHTFSGQNKYYIYFNDISIEKIDTSKPGAPEVTMEAVGFDASVTVTAPTHTVGGDQLTDASLDITVALDGTTVEGGQYTCAPGETRSFEISVPSRGVHTVTAVAKAGDKVSEAGKAEHTFTKVQPVPTPMGYTFGPDADEASWCTIINANEDTQTWEQCESGFPDEGSLFTSAFRYAYSWTMAADDWLILPAFEGGEAGARKLFFNVGTKFSTESMDVHMAYEPTVEALSENKIWSSNNISLNDSFQMEEALFAVEEGKEFYVAFHVTSPANQSYLYLQNIGVEVIDGNMPAAPTLSNPDFDGGDGTVTLTFPENTIAATPLDPSTVLYADVTIDGNPYEGVVEGVPGSTATLSFSNLSFAAHTVTATTYILNEDGSKNGTQSASIEFRCRISSNFAYQIPLDQVLNSESYDNFLIVNANDDDRTWTGESDSFKYNYSSSNTANDWFISPAVEITDPSVLYDVTVTAKVHSNTYPEKIAVYIGREQSVEAMQILAIPVTEVISQEYNAFTGSVSLPEAGRYYIGVQCVSDANQFALYVNRLEMNLSSATLACPGTVTDITWESPETGELYADISFKFPSVTRGDAPLDPETALTATITGASETKTVEGHPGETATVRLTCPRGDSNVNIVVSSEAGSGAPEAFVVNCGPDTPVAPSIADLSVSEDNRSVTITYEAVTSTLNGGHLNIDGMDYYLWEWDEEDEDWYQCDVTDRLSMTYTVSSTDQPLEMITLGLQASNGLNSFSAMTPFTVVLGKPYELPIEETFEGDKLHYEPLTLMSNFDDEYAPTWTIIDPSTLSSSLASPEGGYSLVGSTSFNRGDSYIGLPRFSTEGLENAEIELSVYQWPASCDISLAGLTYGMMQYTLIGTITAPDATEGWTKFKYTLPEELQGRPWSEVRLYVNFIHGSSSIPMIDSYIIRAGEVNGVEEVTDTAAEGKVEGLAGAIRFTGFEGRTATVTNASGVTVAVPVLTGTTRSVELPAGIYVVTVDGNAPYKVAVR